MLNKGKLRPFLKPPTGIGRGRKAKNSAKMSPEDQYRISILQRDIENENNFIPDFLQNRDNVSSEEIREAIIAEVRRTGQTVAQVKPIDLDGRFAEPKDSYFAPLVKGLNNTHVDKIHSERSVDYFFEQHVETIAKNYSTRDLRRFITDELDGKFYSVKGGRPGYIITLSLALQDRFFTRYRANGLQRHRLSEPTSAIDRSVESLKSAFGRRSTWQKRIADIQAKYKGGRK